MIIKILMLKNGQVLISEIQEVSSELGEPDCKLIKPYLIKYENFECFIEPWNSNYTSKDIFMIHSDNILTIMDPKPTILEKYQLILK